jgi:uncharacterized MAPEG superfamily protein
LSIWASAERLSGMTIPFWCLFAAVLLPYVWFSFAAPWRAKHFGKALNLRTPRLQDAELAGRAARAQGAHYNSLEALAYFAPAVLVAHLARADGTWAARLALLFIACRVAHGIAYFADRQPLRTAFFAVGLLSSLGLFVLAACA